ncbi:hypothetical protein TRFO_10283 [Tritrichomonas foetus]|uniref:Uncharacterized protein n=1 Tax=Tritrichomonas foetus TaxID=1144522 RepID=A0A1J4J9J9_9EUKA|nr:hypothetical protein TRFO_10283 [Tritrichomonas foetus]|eukprot:OHS95874.1 hypothetical protein TRFO_10283 [Tritrichomonas foetus]
MLIFFLAQFISCACEDHNLPTAVRALIELIRKMKGSTPLRLFGKDTIQSIPQTSNFTELKQQALNFTMGQFFPQIVVFILSLAAFILTLVFTIFICICCLPIRSTRPGFCITFWWVIFSLFFGVSIAYYILAIIETPKFIDDYPKITEIIDSATVDLKSSFMNLTENYFNLSTSTFSEADGSFGAPSVFVNENGWKIDSLLSSMTNYNNFLNDTIQYINDQISIQKCTYSNISSLNADSLPSLQNSLQNVSETIKKIDLENGGNILTFARNARNILVDYINLLSNDPWVNVPTILDEYRDVELEKAIPSFNTDNSYYKAMEICLYIVFCLLVIYYILQTVAVCMRNDYSRCCVIANMPFSLIAAIIIGVIGIVTTSMACSISEVCDDSSTFAANYYSGKEAFKSTSMPPLQVALFDLDDATLYDLLSFEYFANFSREVNFNAVSAPAKPANFFGLKTSADNLKIELNKSFIINTDLLQVIETALTMRRQMITMNCGSNILDNLTQVINTANIFYFLMNYDLPLVQTAANSFTNYNGEASKNQFVNSFSNLAYKQIFDNEETLGTSKFTCPLRSSKQIFCKETGGTFAYLAVFAHFYLVSLIGFSSLLCCRRKGMISAMYDDEPVNQRNKAPRKNMIWSQNYIISSSSSSSSTMSSKRYSSDSDSFDMFQQSRAGVL